VKLDTCDTYSQYGVAQKNKIIIPYLNESTKVTRKVVLSSPTTHSFRHSQSNQLIMLINRFYIIIKRLQRFAHYNKTLNLVLVKFRGSVIYSPNLKASRSCERTVSRDFEMLSLFSGSIPGDIFPATERKQGLRNFSPRRILKYVLN